MCYLCVLDPSVYSSFFQAEKKKWQKALKNSEEVRYLSLYHFCCYIVSVYFIIRQVIEFSLDAKDKFQPSDRQNFFSSAEKIRLLYHAIQDTTYDVVG